jgi:tetratricopeptide (TPR) repeat protein
MAQKKIGNTDRRQSETDTQESPIAPAEMAVAPRPLETVNAVDLAAAEARKRGTIALNTGHYENAIKAFEEAYTLDQDPDLLFSLAQSYRLAGQPGKALEACSSFLRSANPSTTDRLQAERFMGEIAMIAYQLQLSRDLATAKVSVPTPASTTSQLAIEPPPAPTVVNSKPEPPIAGKEPRLDLTPRTKITVSDNLTSNPTPAEPQTEKHFYQSTTFWIVAGAALVVAGGGLGYWAYERSRGLSSPTTSLGYQSAFP